MTKKNEYMKKHIQRLKQKRKLKKEDKQKQAASRVTNETVAEAREDVLSSARKFVYPLTHSKHRILIISTSLVLAVAIGFTSFMLVALYKTKSTSDFVYQVTKVLPFPIARTGGSFVPYENYLFELKRYIYYYNEVENIDFNDPDYKPQLDDQKKRVLDRIVDMAYIMKIASRKDITVSEAEIDERINTLKDQNRLGNNDSVFEATLKDFYNWTENDFRRSIRNDILTSKVVSSLDVDARTKVNTALEELKKGADFGAVAAQYSDDAQTKTSGGEIPGFINPNDRNILSEQAVVIKQLKVGEMSDVVNVGYGFAIMKKLEEKDGTYRMAHIVVNFKPIQELLNDEKSLHRTTVYVKL